MGSNSKSLGQLVEKIFGTLTTAQDLISAQQAGEAGTGCAQGVKGEGPLFQILPIVIIGIIKNPSDNDAQKGYFIRQASAKGCIQIGEFERSHALGIKAVFIGVAVAQHGG